MSDSATTAGAPRRKNLFDTLELDTRLLGMIGAFVLLCLVFNLFTEGRFLTPRNIFNLTIQTVSVAIMATGMVFVIVQFLAKAGWSVVVRRVAENIMGTIPLFVVLFVPVLIGFHHTHHHWWGGHHADDPLIAHKAPYLNEPFFLARAAFYFATWLALSYLFRSISTKQDETGDHDATRRLQWLAPIAIALFAVTITFAAIDWMKSMDPHWFSTMWGVYYFAGSVVAIFASLSVLTIWLQKDGLVNRIISAEHYHDLGKLLFGFTVFWTYIAFSQYFLIWYANIPEETLWYEHRAHHGWENIGVTLMVGHFFIPFFFLLPRAMKRNPVTLTIGALWLLTIHYVDMYFIVMPIHDTHGPHFSIVDVLCLAGVVSLFLGAFAFVSGRAHLVPVKDPRLPESLAFENF